ncbi:MAG: tRNA lysidine(34) synthetase TilS, partial [Clostridia bacterium]|nr:tRNA lysidine(34) synthetase TilS [Clostridia bacterium]
MMEEQFRKSIEALCLPADATVTVALSGGPDSVVLLDLLRKCRCNFTLKAIHVNHGIRGENARRDAEFCQKLCAEWGIPLEVFEGDAPAYAKEHGMSLEEGARALRYGFLERATTAENAFVATAHHQGDQQETFFLNLYRGSGSGGLSGIKQKRSHYIRPLLGFKKEMLCA